MADCCPFCGAELSFAAERCRDCNLSQDPGARPALEADDAIDEVAYEVSDWPVGSRLRLTGVLAERGIPWRWEPVLNLVVREDDEVAAEAALDEIEAEELGSFGAAGTGGDEGDGEDWEDEDEDDDEGEEEIADDEEDDDEEDDGEEDDGAVAQAAMADLFVAADRLIHDPENLEVAVDLDTAADVVQASPAPYGIDEDSWTTIRQQAAAVRAALDGPESEEDAAGEASDGEGSAGIDPDVVMDAVVSERAQALRDTLRPWI